ncbi:hypothetical protein AFE_1294 [Acidithiobacillus ferrooxidans ATCC 23270]|uniref:Uncharacterized protein n=1 Tax=Acidithiobacillus ferrooxidans (strain ATCC 23270 / DSM 14882 / CIP 104768 / NCIMB 8455) TaxID=243159 RepID=B7J8X6_ACIF2|nr:hypothetical protein AFE_1294 [Acidithiobacillus ferrooxidans ATCC 23270]
MTINQNLFNDPPTPRLRTWGFLYYRTFIQCARKPRYSWRGCRARAGAFILRQCKGS